VDVIVSYNPMFVSSTDKIIIYSCVHKGSNFTMFAELDDVGLDERFVIEIYISQHNGINIQTNILCQILS
jgi:hypothetical protein